MNAATKFYQAWEQAFGRPIKNDDALQLSKALHPHLGYDPDRIYGFLSRAVKLCREHADKNLLDVHNPVAFMWSGLFGSSHWLLNWTHEWFEKNGRR